MIWREVEWQKKSLEVETPLLDYMKDTFWECLFHGSLQKVRGLGLGLKGLAQKSFSLTLFINRGRVKAKMNPLYGDKFRPCCILSLIKIQRYGKKIM